MDFNMIENYWFNDFDFYFFQYMMYKEGGGGYVYYMFLFQINKIFYLVFFVVVIQLIY